MKTFFLDQCSSREGVSCRLLAAILAGRAPQVNKGHVPVPSDFGSQQVVKCVDVASMSFFVR